MRRQSGFAIRVCRRVDEHERFQVLIPTLIDLSTDTLHPPPHDGTAQSLGLTRPASIYSAKTS